MKNLRSAGALALLLLIASCSEQHSQNPQGARSQHELLAVIRQAIQQKDVDAIMALGYWDNVDERMKDGMRRSIPNCFEYSEPSLAIREMSQEERDVVKAHGKAFVWNMEPVGYLVVEGRGAGGPSTSIPIGMRDGRYFIASRYPKN